MANRTPYTCECLGKSAVPELAKFPARHRLVRSFRSRGFVAPEVTNIDLVAGRLLVATDGFWAELSPADRMSFLDGRCYEGRVEYDDCSVLCMNVAEITYAETTFSPEAATNFYIRSAELLDRAITLNPGGGGYYHGIRALAAYMLGDYPAAAAGIKQADLQRFPLFHVVAAVIYAEAGMPDGARRAGETFMRMRPDFIRNILAELTIRNYRPEDQLRLASGLRKVGLPVPDGVEAAIASAAAAPPD
ncbi:hypothetical protein EV132_12639 [Rhizobium sullae]|uniref:Tetratricopeptide repeat protein n=1 Tax=Rhizobium sullae TaxID=50338 RepID=A0A4V2V803_RHISU|nr:hypothetical protein EV132_12639 [Rhizobium sullae]